MNLQINYSKKLPAKMKILAVALGTACIILPASATSITSLTPSLWKGDKSAAVTFSFDDGYADTVNTVVPYMTANHTRGTHYIINSFIGIPYTAYTGMNTGSTLTFATTSELASATANGHEIAAHTVNHTGLAPGQSEIWPGGVWPSSALVQCTDPTYLTANNTNQSWLDSEVHASVQGLNATFSQNTIAMAFPGGQYTQQVLNCLNQDTSANKILTARTSDLGINNSTPANSLALLSEVVETTGTPPGTVGSWMNSAVSSRGWLILQYHIVGPQNYTDGTPYEYYTSTGDFEQALNYAVGQASTIWIDTHSNVYKYIMERNAVSVPGAVHITGLNTFTANASGLSPSIYNEQVTFAVGLSSDWGGAVIVTQAGKSCKTGTGTYSSGNLFAYANVVPNGQTVTLTVPASGDTTPNCNISNPNL